MHFPCESLSIPTCVYYSRHLVLLTFPSDLSLELVYGDLNRLSYVLPFDLLDGFGVTVKDKGVGGLSNQLDVLIAHLAIGWQLNWTPLDNVFPLVVYHSAEYVLAYLLTENHDLFSCLLSHLKNLHDLLSALQWNLASHYERIIVDDLIPTVFELHMRNTSHYF